MRNIRESKNAKFHYNECEEWHREPMHFAEYLLCAVCLKVATIWATISCAIASTLLTSAF